MRMLKYPLVGERKEERAREEREEDEIEKLRLGRWRKIIELRAVLIQSI